MKRLSILLLSVLAYACNKDDGSNDNLPSDRFLLVQDHKWIQDSFYTYFPDDTLKGYASDAPDDTVSYTFTADQYIFSDYFGKQTNSLAYQNPDRIYFWTPGLQRNDSTYFSVVSVDNYHILLQQKRVSMPDLFIYAHAQ